MRELLKGTKIKLTYLKDEDIDAFTHWYEDTKFLRLYSSEPSIPKSPSEISKIFDEVKNSPTSIGLAIRDILSNEILGYLELDGVNYNNGTSWIAIAIGDSKNWGKGYGTEALNLALDFSFNELNLHKLQLTVFEYNKSAIKLYENIGFKKEGSYREYIHRDGKRFDMYLYGMIKSEYKSIL
ncbi:GNAT family N-acetyltransferase [Clostridium sp.]|uniref:GNAT family N-acetyltransferase n=1 Tax=Clostridium sp. TaxID=1506 RepID=UPI003464285D